MASCVLACVHLPFALPGILVLASWKTAQAHFPGQETILHHANTISKWIDDTLLVAAKTIGILLSLMLCYLFYMWVLRVTDFNPQITMNGRSQRYVSEQFENQFWNKMLSDQCILFLCK